MTFHVEPIKQYYFKSLDEVLIHSAEEQRRIYRITLKGLLKNHARFEDDRFFGKGGESLVFNESGLESLCRVAGTTADFMQRIGHGLASQVLNDVLTSGNTTKSIENLEFVCDEDTRQILGIVSTSYVGYSNHQFIDDVLNCLQSGKQKSLIPDLGKFNFKDAYSINTRLRMRVTSKYVAGKVAGRGGTGDDVSEIGVEFSNSMAGGHAVRLAYFIHRLICANGLIAQVGSDKGRIIHSGKEETFRKRLFSKAGGILNSIDNAKRMIETLGDIKFDSQKLAQHVGLDDILTIIQESNTREECRSRLVDSGDYSQMPPKERKIFRDANSIEQIPELIGGHEAQQVFKSYWRSDASMYDFINIFTDLAKSFTPSQRLQTEEKAGDLASWISQNKRKFK